MRGFLEYIVVIVAVLLFTLYHAVLTTLVIGLEGEVFYPFYYIFVVEVLAFLPLVLTLIGVLLASNKYPQFFSFFNAKIFLVHLLAAFCLFVIHAVWQQFINAVFFHMEFSIASVTGDFMQFLEMRFFVYIIIFGLVGGIVKLREQQEVAQREARLKKELYKAKLKEIELKMNPEIIYTNLNYIKKKAKTNTKEASQMVILMAGLLRKLVDNLENERISIFDDMQFFRTYVNMLSLRLEKKIDPVSDVSGISTNYQIPSLVLIIPLLEELFFGKFASHTQTVSTLEYKAYRRINGYVNVDICCGDVADAVSLKEKIEKEPFIKTINDLLNGFSDQFYQFKIVAKESTLILKLQTATVAYVGQGRELQNV